MLEIIVRIFKVFNDNNLFNEGVELIGSWCFQLYQTHLGAKKFPLKTQDIDFLIPNPYRGKEHTDLINQLEKLGFKVDFKRDGSLYLWNAELKIEFITPEKGRGVDNAIKVKELGFNAIPLRFVILLLDKPITIQEKGIKILVPNPVNFCLHKLIVASIRKEEEKILKDLQQAICTSVIIDSKETQKLFVSLPKKWRKVTIKMLEKAQEVLPLLKEETKKLEFTLQDAEKQKM
jgi:hypothetical protein